MTALFEPERHEPLTACAWDEARARAAIAEIAAEAEAAFDPDSLWPAHPLDEEPDDPGWMWSAVYLGAAGIVWALDALRRAGLVERRREYADFADGLHARYLASPDLERPLPSLLMGEAGILLVAQRLAPTAARADRLLELVRANVDSPENELMWGNPGTMLVAQALHEATRDDRWRDVWRAGADRLWDEWRHDEELGCHVWKQRLSGREQCNLGPAHGYAGNVLALARGAASLPAERAAELELRAAETLERFAVREDGLANWPTGPGLPLASGRDVQIRTQWCHGAPGMVASLAGLAPHDDGFGELLAAGGELTWTAGPLAKGSGLCHGTAGNGVALLKLFERTGDERWLQRARSFGTHALEQVDRARAEYGRGRFSLWTGDLGVALYLAGCIDGRAELPMLDPAV